MATVSITGTYGTAGQIGPTYTYIIKKTLERAHPAMPLHQFVQKRFIPLNSGKTAQFTRLLHIPVGAQLTEGAVTTTIPVYAQDFNVTVVQWGKAIACSTFLDDTFITPALEAHLELLGLNAGETMNLELQKTLWGEDYDETTNTYEANVGCIGLTGHATAATLGYLNHSITADSTGTTTTLAAEGDIGNKYANNDDTYLGGSIVFTNPQSQNYGLGRRVFDYASATGVVTWKTAVKNITGCVADTFTTGHETARINSLGSSTGLSLVAGTDILTASLLRRAVGMLRKESAEPIQPPYFVAVVSPEEYHNLSSGTATGDFLDFLKYTDAMPLLQNEVGKLAGCKVVLDNRPYKLAITSPFDYSSTGGLHLSFVLGKNALGACGLQGQNALSESDTQVIIKKPGPQTTSDPLNAFGTAGWKTSFARLSLNACNAVGIITYPNVL